MSVKDKWVRRFSVDETFKHKSGFTIYKITSVLFPIESPEAMTVVSVWKRYSDVQQLHKSMRVLHAGLHLRGTFPALARHSYFKRFHKEVVEERAKSIKTILEFLAEHRLLFTSTDFVNFLQTGYPEPEPSAAGVINSIRSSLHLPIEETPPLEYQTSDEDTRSPLETAQTTQRTNQSIDELDFISQIPIYEASEVEQPHRLSKTDSFDSINSLDSIDSDMHDELKRGAIEKRAPKVLPDLINFEEPSTSMAKASLRSLSIVGSETRTEDSYVFEAGYALNLAARSEDLGDYRGAFDHYKSGIEKMLIGVQGDSDPQRRALIKAKTNKYLSYAEAIYKNHLCTPDQTLSQVIRVDGRGDESGERGERGERCPQEGMSYGAVPLAMLRRPYSELASFRVLAVSKALLVLHRVKREHYVIKVLQKIPNNLTEFDEYFLQNTNETRKAMLPTSIPFMVPLQGYIETNNLIFLILAYAPGEKLFDYIKRYSKSVPNTPARELNLENVFSEPKTKNIDVDNDNIDKDVDVDVESVNNNNIEANTDDVSELVRNSQKLLRNVDKALSESVAKVSLDEQENNLIPAKEDGKKTVEQPKGTTPINSQGPSGVTAPAAAGAIPAIAAIPASTLCTWGAQLLLALEGLHNAGVVCRYLNPSHVLLGPGGSLQLTYRYGYPGSDMALATLRAKAHLGLHLAPELHSPDLVLGSQEAPHYVCDFWSYGVIMYELLCGVPLSQFHSSFCSHSLLQTPEGLSLEEQSLLTQLLTFSPSERLGSGPEGVDEIKRHPYFKHVQWHNIAHGYTG